MKSLCKVCNEKEVKCKKMCHACYVKERRKLPHVKEALKKYNNSDKAKIARQKFLDKKPKKNKKIKEKVYCECGKLSFAKGLCSTCYQRQYSRKRYNYKSIRTNFNKEQNKYNKLNNDLFNKLLDKIENGCTISRACEILKINRSTLYKKITPKQKTELIAYREIGKIK